MDSVTGAVKSRQKGMVAHVDDEPTIPRRCGTLLPINAIRGTIVEGAVNLAVIAASAVTGIIIVVPSNQVILTLIARFLIHRRPCHPFVSITRVLR